MRYEPIPQHHRPQRKRRTERELPRYSANEGRAGPPGKRRSSRYELPLPTRSRIQGLGWGGPARHGFGTSSATRRPVGRADPLRGDKWGHRAATNNMAQQDRVIPLNEFEGNNNIRPGTRFVVGHHSRGTGAGGRATWRTTLSATCASNGGCGRYDKGMRISGLDGESPIGPRSK